MKKAIVVLSAFVLFAGCVSTGQIGTGPALTDIPATVAEGYSLDEAVLSAATRRRWTPRKISPGLYRLTINQRGNVCSVDVAIGNGCYSILPVESTISVRKYEQWVNNL